MLTSRWWYSDESKSNGKEKDKALKSKKSPSKRADEIRKWRFSVIVNFDLNPYEKVAVVGGCDELGLWKSDHAELLENTEENRWTKEIEIPNGEIPFRYCIVAVDQLRDCDSFHVRRWETHFNPRKIGSDAVDGQTDTFGIIDGVEKIDRGWLNNETVLQLKFYRNPFLLKDRVKNRLLYVKLTAMNLRTNAEASGVEENSISNDTRETSTDQPAYAFSEVATFTSDNFTFQPQEQFGRAYYKDDILIFHITVTEPENIAYLIDLYTFKTRSEDGEPPYHLGYHYLLPNLLKKSEGQLELPITCASKHRPLGMMKIEFLKTTPLPDVTMDMEKSYVRYWNQKYKGLDVGHRGSGTSFKVSSGNSIRENTIASLKRAGESGADFVEFDVQLSKDLHPVIYHDFHVYVSLKKKATISEHDMLELPMRELTLEQLKNLKVYHVVEGRSREPKFFDEDLAEHQPFPELSEALQALDEKIGFNIEVKWAQLLENGMLEDNHSSIDMNLYLDCILELVLSKAGKRKIIFSCFDADVCVMLRNKQNKYPVMFLTIGQTNRYPNYNNPCGRSMENAVKFCVANELLGIVAHTEDLLRDISQINFPKQHGMILFCWGDDNNSPDTIKFLKEQGLHAIIYDKLDVLKEKVYYVTSKESQLSLLEQIDLENRLSGPSSF